MYNNKSNVQKVKNSMWSRVVLGAMLLGMSISSQASLAGFDLQDSPDISALALTTNYFSSSEVFEATGFASELTYNGFTYQISSTSNTPEYILEANINDSGVFTAGVSSFIEIGGVLSSNTSNTNNNGLPAGYTASSSSLLSGKLTQFGSDTGILYFLFEVTGGDAAGLFGGFGSIGAIILRGSGFSMDWAESFSRVDAQSDNGIRATVPEPTSIWLLGSAIIGLAGFSRRKKNK